MEAPYALLLIQIYVSQDASPALALQANMFSSAPPLQGTMVIAGLASSVPLIMQNSDGSRIVALKKVRLLLALSQTVVTSPLQEVPNPEMPIVVVT